MDPKLITLYSPVGIDLRCESCKTVILQPLEASMLEGVTLQTIVRAGLRHACAN